jgi:hypothetical protein
MVYQVKVMLVVKALMAVAEQVAEAEAQDRLVMMLHMLPPHRRVVQELH